MQEYEYVLCLNMQGVPFAKHTHYEAPAEYFLMDSRLRKMRFKRTTKRYEKDGKVYWHYEWDCKPYND